MRLSRLELRDWRCYDSLKLELEDGLTVIEGGNGEGKTNIAEAIYYLSLAHSWRSSEDTPLRRVGCQNSLVRACVCEGGFRRLIEVRLSREGKRILLNDKPVRRLSELSTLVNVLLFTPEDTELFTASPSLRRNFLDVNISKVDVGYLNSIGSYRHLLVERNGALKLEKGDRSYVEVLTDQMVEVQKSIVLKRFAYVERLNEALSTLASRLFGQTRSVRLVYRPFIYPDDKFTEEAKKAYQRSLETDLLRKSTSVGVHREDFQLLLDGKDVGTYGSQGENRLSAIALKLCPYFLIEEEGKKPIAVLDDVYSELDGFHASSLTALLKDMGQVFVTATDLKIQGASYIEVAAHQARRRNEYGE